MLKKNIFIDSEAELSDDVFEKEQPTTRQRRSKRGRKQISSSCEGGLLIAGPVDFPPVSKRPRDDSPVSSSKKYRSKPPSLEHIEGSDVENPCQDDSCSKQTLHPRSNGATPVVRGSECLEKNDSPSSNTEQLNEVEKVKLVAKSLGIWLSKETGSGRGVEEGRAMDNDAPAPNPFHINPRPTRMLGEEEPMIEETSRTLGPSNLSVTLCGGPEPLFELERRWNTVKINYVCVKKEGILELYQYIRLAECAFEMIHDKKCPPELIVPLGGDIKMAIRAPYVCINIRDFNVAGKKGLVTIRLNEAQDFFNFVKTQFADYVPKCKDLVQFQFN